MSQLLVRGEQHRRPMTSCGPADIATCERGIDGCFDRPEVADGCGAADGLGWVLAAKLRCCGRDCALAKNLRQVSGVSPTRS